jgi:hypothetical protein
LVGSTGMSYTVGLSIVALLSDPIH